MAVLVGNSLKAQSFPADSAYYKDSLYHFGFVGFNAKGDSIYTSIQIEASFPGGLKGWKTYLEHNLDVSLGDRYIKVPTGHLYAKATITVTFQVSKEGDIFDAQVDSVSIATVHKKLVAEALRVIKESPRWSPAWQNGHHVAYQAKQSINFIARNTLD